MNPMDESGLRQRIRTQIQTLLTTDRPSVQANAHAELLARFEAAFAASDVAGMVSSMAPNVVWQLPTGEVLHGREQVAAFLRKRATDADAPRIFASQWHAMGDTVIQNYRVSLPTTSRELDGCAIYRMEQGLIRRVDAYWKQVQPTHKPMSPSSQSLSAPVTILPMGDGVLRFEVKLPSAAAPAACSCQSPQSAAASSHAAADAKALDGLISERRLAELNPLPTRVVISADAVLTPQARDWLRKHKLAVQRSEA